MDSGVGWSLGDIRIERLVGEPPPEFDCGREAQNDYLLDRAQHDQAQGFSTTYLALVKGIPAGYLSLCTDAIVLSVRERPFKKGFAKLPAIKLAQLGVDQHFQGMGLGKHLVAVAIEAARAVREDIGCRYLTLDSQPDLVSWYESQGFLVNEKEQRGRRKTAKEYERDPDLENVSMRFDLRKLVEQEQLPL